LLVCAVLLACVLFGGCAKSYFGSDWAGYDRFPAKRISPQEAISRAEPWLDQTFALRSSGRGGVSDKEPVVHLTLQGNFYYVVKDNYPSYSPGFYLRHAVKVHKDTGAVVPPASDRK